jgi:hypothetical protein
MQTRWAVPLLIAGMVGAAWANGGPVEWTLASGRGGLSPVAVDVALVAEDLRIAVAADGRHVDVVATYELANPGAARRVTFGVPVASTDAASARTLARTISVTSGGRRRGCRLTDERAEQAPGGDEEYMLRPAVWCTTALTVAAGASTVTLRYRGELEFSDSELSKSPLVSRNYRTLSYPLYPAGGWKGPSKLHVEVDPGPLAGLIDLTGEHVEAPKPAGSALRGDKLVWSIDRIDLAAMPELRVVFLPEPFFLPRDLAAWNRGASYYRVSARAASSTLGGGRYDIGRIVDGDPATAWCEGRRGDGAGEWIEVEVRGTPDDLAGCRPSAPGLISGYAKSAAVWNANGRVTRVRFGPCGSSGGEVVDVPRAPSFDRGGALLPVPPHEDAVRSLHERGTMCLRMTIVDVEAGSSGDTCVSELAPLINCG